MRDVPAVLGEPRPGAGPVCRRVPGKALAAAHAGVAPRPPQGQGRVRAAAARSASGRRRWWGSWACSRFPAAPPPVRRGHARGPRVRSRRPVPRLLLELPCSRSRCFARSPQGTGGRPLWEKTRGRMGTGGRNCPGMRPVTAVRYSSRDADDGWGAGRVGQAGLPGKSAQPRSKSGARLGDPAQARPPQWLSGRSMAAARTASARCPRCRGVLSDGLGVLLRWPQ